MQSALILKFLSDTDEPIYVFGYVCYEYINIYIQLFYSKW